MSETSDKLTDISPGLLLKQARNKKRLRFKKLSSELKISESYIKAIESGDYSLIPGGTTYIRGYMRAYASLLGIDPDIVVQSYEAELPLKKERRLYLTDLQSKKNLSKTIKKIINSILGISILGLIFFVFNNQFYLASFSEGFNLKHKVSFRNPKTFSKVFIESSNNFSVKYNEKVIDLFIYVNIERT